MDDASNFSRHVNESNLPIWICTVYSLKLKPYKSSNSGPTSQQVPWWLTESLGFDFREQHRLLKHFPGPLRDDKARC